jgi:hypothetical protein
VPRSLIPKFLVLVSDELVGNSFTASEILVLDSATTVCREFIKRKTFLFFGDKKSDGFL